MAKERNEWREIEDFIEKAHKKRLKEMVKKKVLIGVAIAAVAIVVAACAVVLMKPWVAPTAAVYGVELSCAEPDKTINIGATATYQISVRNTGNVKDTISISRTSPPTGWAATLSSESVILDAGGETTITLNVVAPHAVGSAAITVTGTSQGDPTKSSSISRTTTAISPYGIELSCLELSKYITRGRSVIYEITVKNNGTVSDTINLTITRSSLDWPVSFNLSPEIVFAPGDFTKFAEKALAPGDFAELTLRVTAGDFAEGAQLTVWVNATSTSDPTKKDSIALTTSVRAITGISIKVEKKNIDGIGYNNDLRISVCDSNNLPVDNASIYIDRKYKGKTGPGDFAPGDFEALNVADGWREVKAIYQTFVSSTVIDVGNTLYITTEVLPSTRGVGGGYSSVVTHVYNDTGAVADAIIYINNRYMGKTNSTGNLTVTLPHGKHIIKAVKAGSLYTGNATAEVGYFIYAEWLWDWNVLALDSGWVYVKDSNHLPVANASVILNSNYRGNTSAEGKLYLSNLYPGKYKVDVYYGTLYAYTEFTVGDYMTTDYTISAFDGDGIYNDVEFYVWNSTNYPISNAKIFTDNVYQGKTVNGTCTVKNLSSGKHEVHIVHDSFSDVFFDIYIEGVVEGWKKGYVCDASSFTPIEGAWVYVYSADYSFYNYTQTDANGSFKFNLSPGKYEIYVWAEGYYSYYESFYLRSGEIVLNNIRLKAPTTVDDCRKEGYVYDKENHMSIEGAYVYIYSTDYWYY
ncbi:MAG: carboxypeptidase regulatory-like domain-containing protein, partial [Candidatus Thermoplasmatota archaeon]|nr:carboxypeptidase regulatory-like domain-containing protein [Candidatus Thermoplasmatota archaeon]